MLRDYQREALENIRHEIDAGTKKMLGVLPTGSGKTVIFAQIPGFIGLKDSDLKMMVLVHRNELVYQAADKLRKYNPNLRVGIEKASEKSHALDDIVVASVQSIGRDKLVDGRYVPCERLKRLVADGEYGIVVTDECHHAVKGSSYAAVYRALGCYKPEPEYDTSNTISLGVTATASRSDSLGMELILDKIAFSREIRQMIEEKWLADIEAWRVDTEADISDVKTRHGDLALEELSKKVDTPERNRLIVEKYAEHGRWLPAFGFTCDVAHAVNLAREFNREGIHASMICGKTPKEERERILQDFRAGEIRVLTSAGVLSEGIDIPSVCVGLMARPTKSNLLYIQQIGRILRPHPSPEELTQMKADGREPDWIKPHAIVLDFCDLSGRHQLNTVPTLFGLRPDFDMGGKKATDTVAEVERIIREKQLPVGADQFRSVEELKGIAERVDLFKKPHIPDEIKAVSQLAWLTGPTGGYQLCLPDYAVLRVTQDTLGRWCCHRSVKGVRSQLFEGPELSQVIRRAETVVPPEALINLAAEARWRHDKATESQAEVVWKNDPAARKGFKHMLEFTPWFCENYTKGEASNRISSILGARR